MTGALFKKNVRRLWRESLAFVATGFALSLLDARESFLEPLAVVVLVLLVPLVASTCFSPDREHDAGRFLAYLPVKTTQVWLASYLFGLLVLALVTLGLTWWHVWFWTPPDRPGSLLIAPLSMALLVGGLSFCGLGLVAFWQTLGHSVAVVIAAAFTSLLLMHLLVMVMVRQGAFPPPHQMVVLLWTVGLAFAAGGLLQAAFVCPADTLLQRLSVAVPLALTLSALAAFLGTAGDWRRLVPGEWLTVAPVGTAQADGSERLLIAVDGDRSFRHLLSVDLPSASFRDFGSLELLGDPEEAPQLDPEGHLLARSYHPLEDMPRGVFAALLAPLLPPIVIVSVDPGSGERRPLLPGLARGSEAFAPRFAANGVKSWLERPSGEPQVTQTTLHLMHGGRETIVRVPSTEYHVSGSGLAIARSAEPTGDPGGTDSPADPFVLSDAKRGTTTRLELPGQVLRFSPDLDRAACLRHRIDGVRRRESVVLVDVPGGREQVLLDESDLPVLVVEAEDNRVPYRHSNLIERSPWGQDTIPLHFDDRFEHAVWMARQVREGAIETEIVWIDLATGARRVVVTAGELGRPDAPDPLRGSGSEPKLIGLTSDGGALVYELGRALHLADVDGAGSRQLAELASENSPYELSPSRRRVCVLIQPDRDHIRSRLEIHEVGSRRLLWQSRRGVWRCLWLDEERVAIADSQGEVWLFELTTGRRRILFPPWASELPRYR